MKYTIITLALMLCCIAGCKKDETGEKDNSKCAAYPVLKNNIDKGIKKLMFKKGSYWVYREQDTEARDSVYVSEYSDGYDGLTKYTGADCDSTGIQHVYMTLKSTYYPNNTVTWEAVGTDTGFLYVRDRGLLNPVFWLYNRDTHRDRGCSSYLESYPFMNTEFGFYPNVDVFIQESNNGICVTDNKNRTSFYFAPDVGIVKKIVYDTPNQSDIWELVDWKIVK